ncbi:MAG: hypothetical protein GY751_18405 [Bacteroidetes bacterium]|nr:hypothetical protein [Bacteroidota bacterium]
MKNLIVIILVLLTAIQSHAGDAFSYSWTFEKEIVGNLNVNTETSGEETIVTYASTYTVEMPVELKSIDNWSVSYSAENVMTGCELRNELNGRTRVDIVEGASDGAVTRSVNGKAKQLERSAVSFSYILLFVKEPVGISELYSELYGMNFQVRETGKRSYTITDSRNRRHKFNYDESGNLLKAEIIMSMGNFTLTAD